ncbi:phage tail spike protein [Bacillus mycoides]
MTEISGDLHIVDYKTKMVIASLKPEDYIEDLRHWELKDNADILDIKLLDESPFLIYFQQKNLILKETRSGVITPYVITEIAKDSAAHTATVYASGEWIKLDKDAYISPQKITSKDAAYYMNFATARTIWEVGIIEAVGTRTMTIDTFTSPLRFIKEVATLFDNVEIQYRIVMNPTKPPTRYIDLVKKRGRETDKEIILGKDLLGIKRIENSENIITALVPFVMGRDADGNDKLITIESVNNGLQYIVDDAAYQRWNVDGKHLFGFYTPETDNEDMAPARLLTLAKTELKKRVDTIVSYEVDSVDISRVFGYEHEAVGEGDTIRIIDEGMTPTLYLEARAVAGDESRKDKRKNKYTFGNFVEIINPDEALRKLYQKMLTMIGDKVPKEWFGALETKLEETKKKADTAAEESQTAKDLANATKDYMEQNLVDIIESVKPPTVNLKPNKTLWRDISGGKPGILKIWTGTVWESVVPDTAPLQKSIKDTETEINTLKNTVKDLPDKAWLNQQFEGKADKEGVYTKDWVNNNLIGKQVYETNRKGDIEKLTETTTIAERTAEEIKSKVEKTVVTQLGNDLANVSQTANTAKQTAESNTNTITSLQTTVSNISVGSINLSSGSETGLNKQNMTGTWSDSKQMTVSDKVNYRNKTFTISFLFTGKMTKLNTNCWFGVETAITYADGEQEWKPIRADGKLSLNVEYKDEPLYVTFKTKDKDVTKITFYYSGRNIDGNLNSHHAKFEEGNIRTTWQAANEEITSKSDFTKTTNELKQTVDTNSQTISKVQQDQGTMQSTLNQVKQTTDLNSQTITTLSQTQGQQGAIIQQNTSDITQLNNQIKSKVTDIQMQEYVGGLGSSNELFNSAFETRVINASTGAVTSRTPSITKWNLWANGTNFTAIPESARHHDGFNSVKLETSGLTANTPTSLYQPVPSQANSGDHVFSAWFYTDNKALLDGGAYMEVSYYNGGTWVASKAVQLVPLLVNNSWVFASATLLAPATAHNAVRGSVTINRNGRLWVSQPQLQKGTTPSTFMENPKDYANYEQLVGEIAKKVATSEFNSKVSTIETSINQQSSRIDLKAEKNDIYNKIDSDGRYGSKAIVESHTSQLSVMSTEINLRVKSGDIASTINQTAQSVLIQAGKIYLDGFIEAKHLKAQELVGVTIKTVPNGQQRYVKLNQQNIELYDRDTVRGEFRFFNKSDGTSINPTITLGRSVSGGIVGALNISQWTPINAQGVDNYQNAQAAIGMVEQYNSNSNEFTYGSRINFFKNGQMDIKTNYNLTLSASQQGHIQITTDTVGQNKSIFIEPSLNLEVTAGNSIWLSAKGGSFNADASTNHTFKNGSGNFYFENTTKTSGNNMLLSDDNHNAELRMAYVKIRSSHDSGYQGKIQLVQTGGGGYAGLECADVSYTSLTNRSSRKIKSNIRDLEIDALEKIMNLKVQQYNFKSDVEKLYKMREDAVGSGQLFTTRDIPLQYGLILEDTDSTFVADLGDGINLYTLVTLNVDATQKIKLTQDVHEEEISILKSQVASQEDRIARLEELLLQQLINKKPEQP